jgi:hypothetical protein
MHCTAVSGCKLPIGMVGISKNPKYFGLIDKLPLPYTHQKMLGLIKM